MTNQIKLKIADLIIQLKSKFPIEPVKKRDSFRYKNFIYSGTRNPDICIELKLVRNLPLLDKSLERIFLTRHPDTNGINWALYKNRNSYILREFISQKRQYYLLSRDFRKIKAYLAKNKNDKFSWGIDEIIYDALQVILIHYLAKKGGLFIHAFGVKDDKGRGFLFIGKSGKGKTTSAKLWHKYSKDKILNDDRIILRKFRNRFFIYGSPWHGDFSDYLASKVDRARLKRIFFIYHSQRNRVRPMENRLFSFLYPCLFPAFWERGSLEKNVSLCHELLNDIPCFRLGFKNDKRVIGFVNEINKSLDRSINIVHSPQSMDHRRG